MTTSITNRDLKKYFLIMSFGLLINVSAYVGVLTLQSSINIQKNLGTVSASVLYITSAVLCLFVTPVLLVRFDAKWCLVLGELGFTIYSLSNLYPSFYTMIPGAIFGAFGESFIWSAGPLYVNHVTAQMWKNLDNDGTDEESLRNKWLGYFYSLTKSCVIWGNLLSYATLYGARHLNVMGPDNNTSTNNAFTCGSYMCSSTDYTETLHKYVPSSKASLYITFSLYVTFQIISVIMHSCLLPSSLQTQEVQNKTNSLELFWKTFQSTMNHLISRDHLLLTPMTFYYGYYIGFLYAVFTKAFVSCTIGVQQVGLVMSCYGLSNSVSAFALGWISHKFGITPVVIFGLFYDVCGYTILLTWEPSFENIYWVYAIGLYIGVTDGIWQLSVISTVSTYFQTEKEVAFGIVSLLTVLGLFFGFVLAPIICVKTHIYSLIGILIAGCCGYAIVTVLRKSTFFSESEREAEMILQTNEHKELE